MYTYRDCNYEDWYTWSNKPEKNAAGYIFSISHRVPRKTPKAMKYGKKTEYCVSERISLAFQMPWGHQR